MFAPSLLAPLRGWEHHQLCVGVDIGGSGLRIRISNSLNPADFIDVPHIRAKSTKEAVATFQSLEDALVEVAADYETRGASLAVAGPIKSGSVVLTNWPGDAAARTLTLEALPQRLFPKSRTALLNDLEAGAYGLIAGDEQQLLDHHFVQLWTDGATGPVVDRERTCVLALGSGLGVALIVKMAGLSDPLVVPCECGHLQVPTVCEKDPHYEEERALVQHISDHYYEGRQQPEYEDLCSGRGLQLCFQFFAKRDRNENLVMENIDAADVADKAKAGDKAARAAMVWCYKLFLRCARGLCITLCCDSIVMALDNQVKNAWFVDAVADILKEEFFAYSRPEWLEEKRIYSQIESLNFNILGVDYMAHRIAAKH